MGYSEKVDRLGLVDVGPEAEALSRAREAVDPRVRVAIVSEAAKALLLWLAKNNREAYSQARGRSVQLAKTKGVTKALKLELVWDEFSPMLPTAEREGIIRNVGLQEAAAGMARAVLDAKPGDEELEAEDVEAERAVELALEEQEAKAEERLKMPDLRGLLWILHHLHDDKVKPRQAPSLLEWSLLIAARQSPKITEMLYQKVSAKSYIGAEDTTEDDIALETSGLREHLLEYWLLCAKEATEAGFGPERLRDLDSEFHKAIHGRLAEVQRRTA